MSASPIANETHDGGLTGPESLLKLPPQTQERRTNVMART